jgi:cyclic pyranopterin phosphate synthase
LADLKLIDPYNRHLNYLRISITDRCNLKCIYCVPRDLIPRLSHDEILTYEEILRLVRIGIRLGISKIRVTGRRRTSGEKRGVRFFDRLKRT